MSNVAGRPAPTSRPAPPALTVRYDGSTRTFAPGNDVVVGRDLRADIRIAHPLISRAHLVLRFDQGRWVAIDNGSLNGMFANNRRVPALDISDGQTVNIGNPDGPRLIFEVGRNTGSAGRTPTMAVPIGTQRPPSAPYPTQAPQTSGPQTVRPYGRPPGPPAEAPPGQPMYPPGPPPAGPRYPTSSPSTSQPAHTSGAASYPSAPSASYPPAPSTSQPVHAQQYSPPISAPEFESVTAMGPTAAPRSSEGNLATSMLKILRPGSRPAENVPGAIKIGRATDNDIVVPDVLASRHHATLMPTAAGTEIQDNRSINGTFVNGARVESALLRDGDTVTIGNIDLVFSGGTLLRRTETEAATRTGGLEVHGITWTIENNKTLLDNISIAARPGTLTAVIGPSGAGKSTFARLVAGYTQPTTGTVTFEGHNVHSEYASLRSRI
ncbi:MAG TPA: FHA domain-containing protein, partial [Mycobacterium sp.]|nr:FHA domain-containing protein [Mycobacterium sp.]